MTIEVNSVLLDVQAKLKNFSITGFSNGKFTELEGFEQNVIKLKLRTEKMKINSAYDAVGSILFIPVSGKGNMEMIVGEMI